VPENWYAKTILEAPDILLVEHKKEDCNLICAAFENLSPGIALTIAQTVSEAQTYLTTMLPSLMIIDLDLPDSTQLLPQEKEYPILLLVSYGNEQAAVEAVKDGAAEYLIKTSATLSDLPRVAGRALQAWTHLTERRQAEAALRGSEERLRAFVDALPDLAFILDENGRHIEVLTGQKKLLRVAEQEMKNKLLHDVLPQKEADDLLALVQRTIKTGQPQIIEYALDVLAGRRWFEGRTWPLPPLTDGLVVLVSRDITELKQTQEALRKSEARYRAIVEDQTELIARYKPDGTILFVNEAYARYFGQPRGVMLGANLLEQLSPEHRVALKEIFTQLSPSKPAHTNEHKAVETDDKIRWRQWIDRGIFDEHGQLIEIQSVGRDITQQKQAEEKIQQRNRELGLLNQIIAASAASQDTDLILETACRELAQTFNLPLATAIFLNEQKKVLEIVADYHTLEQPSLVGQEIPFLNNPIVDYLTEHEKPLIIEDLQTDPQLDPIRDMLRRWGAGSALFAPIFVRGKFAGGLSLATTSPHPFTSEEISLTWSVTGQIGGALARIQLDEERRRLEEEYHQSQKMESVGRLAAGIAHDFNNLLTVINGFADLIQFELPSDAPQQEALGKIIHAGQRASELVRQLLAFSRKQVIQPQVVNLNSNVAKMNKMLRRIIGEDLDLKTILAPDLWNIKVDPAQIEQVIVNLAVNARDVMPSGGQLTIETANVTLDSEYAASHLDIQPGDYVLLAMSDTGPGIRQEIRNYIFEPFFTTKETGKGTGLGLATAFGIVKQSGGSIYVYTEANVGTTFKVYLPRIQEAAPAAVARPKVTLPIPSGGETILLVEDDEYVREFAGTVLQEQGYKLLEAENGQQALQLVAKYKDSIDLLLTDVIMPEMGGKLLREQLIKIRPKLKTLYMSGYTDNAIAHHGVLDANVAFLQKPFTPVTLVRKVRSVLDGE